ACAPVASSGMPQGNDRAAARSFSFLILRSAAPSEASRNFTRDRRSRAKEFSARFPSEKHTLLVCPFRQVAEKLPPHSVTVSPARGVVLLGSVLPRSTTGPRRFAVLQSASSRQAC